MRRLDSFLRCRRGIAAAEFALILPLMVLVLAGTVELGNALLLDRKVTRAAHTAADLVAQARSVTTAELDDVFDAVQQILQPFPATMQITVTSVYLDPSTTSLRVVWSQSRNGTAHPQGSSFTLPQANMLLPGESVIVSEISYGYSPLFADLILSGVTLRDQAYLKPRRVAQVARL
jgi:Flp pilus assembly protein TadG